MKYLFHPVDTIFFHNLDLFNLFPDIDAILEWLHNHRWWWNNWNGEDNRSIIIEIVVEFNDTLHFIF